MKSNEIYRLGSFLGLKPRDIQKIISNLKGHHEPQEELCFYYILKLLDRNANMLELGCAWCYYSMFFKNEIIDGQNVCIEPKWRILSSKNLYCVVSFDFNNPSLFKFSVI